jgi:hypothetical protein
VPSDQDLHCSPFDLLGYFWSKSNHYRSWSDGTDVPADLNLNWSPMSKKAYTWSKWSSQKFNLGSCALTAAFTEFFHNFHSLLLTRQCKFLQSYLTQIHLTLYSMQNGCYHMGKPKSVDADQWNICAIWSWSTMFTFWFINLGCSDPEANSVDADQTARTCNQIWIYTVRTCIKTCINGVNG